MQTGTLWFGHMSQIFMGNGYIMNKLLLGILLVLVYSGAQANSINYLDPKTAFCYSDNSLGRYLSFVQIRDINGLNRLVLAGECDFVPDDKIMPVTNYEEKKIGSMPVVSFRLEGKTLWTFKKLVQRVAVN